jgi:hypothetical protein
MTPPHCEWPTTMMWRTLMTSGRELDHRQAVEVRVDDDVGDVAVDEQLARIEVDQLVGGNAAVGTADPQVFRSLLLEPGR